MPGWKDRRQSDEHIAKRVASYSKTRAAQREQEFWQSVDKRSDDECWIWLKSCTRIGYGRVSLGCKTYLAHRVAYYFSHPGKITLQGPKNRRAHGLVLHTCDNRRCCNPRHLYVGTHAENMRDRQIRNRTHHPKWISVESPGAAFTATEVREIRRKREAGVSAKLLSIEFGVHEDTIYDCVARRSYKDVI